MRGDRVFRIALLVSGVFVLVLVGASFITLLLHSMPTIKAFGLNFFVEKTWDPVFGKFGALPFLVGTLLTSFLALIISLPFSLAISILLGEYFREGLFPSFVKSVVELLAGVPSVIYGLWGLFVLVPLVRKFEMKLGMIPYGVGIFTASLILSVMILPYSASLGAEVISLVPQDLKEAAYSLGATRHEVIMKIILPYAKSGIIAGIIMALGRAVGETMAVTMVIGNSNFLPKSIFSPGNTMASVIANEFAEATKKLHVSALVEIGLVLFLVTTVLSIIGKWIIKKTTVERYG